MALEPLTELTEAEQNEIPEVVVDGLLEVWPEPTALWMPGSESAIALDRAVLATVRAMRAVDDDLLREAVRVARQTASVDPWVLELALRAALPVLMRESGGGD